MKNYSFLLILLSFSYAVKAVSAPNNPVLMNIALCSTAATITGATNEAIYTSMLLIDEIKKETNNDRAVTAELVASYLKAAQKNLLAVAKAQNMHLKALAKNYFTDAECERLLTDL